MEGGNPPWRNITSLLHESSQGEPETVEYPKLIRLIIGWLVPSFLKFLCVPLIRAEAAHQEEDNTHSNVGKNNAHPYFVSQRIQKGKHSWFGLLRFFYHDRDT